MTPATTQAPELVFGVFNLQSLTPGFLPGGSYAALSPVSGGVAGQMLQPMYQSVTAVWAQEATGTLSSFQSWDGLIVTYKSGDQLGAVAPASTARPRSPDSLGRIDADRLEGHAERDARTRIRLPVAAVHRARRSMRRHRIRERPD